MVILPDRLVFSAATLIVALRIFVLLGAMAVRRASPSPPLGRYRNCEIQFRKTKLKFADTAFAQTALVEFSAMRNAVSRFLTAREACH
jgi:hypothetical protein